MTHGHNRCCPGYKCVKSSQANLADSRVGNRYPMIVTKTEIPDVLIIEPKLFGDQRGFFLETFQVERYQSHGIKGPFVQDNLSRSAQGVLRGLHLQNPTTQGKLVSVLRGLV